MDFKSSFDIAGLNPDWWMDASRTDKTTVVSGTANQILSIVDASSFDQVLVVSQPTPAIGPGNKTVLNFNGIGNDMLANFGDNLNSDWELVVVFRTSSSGTKTLFSQQDGSGTGRSVFQVLSSGVLSSFFGGATSASTILVDDNKFHVGTFRYTDSTNTLRVYVDGDLENTTTRANNLATGNWRFGVNKNDTSEHWLGDFAEGFKITGLNPDTTFNAYQKHLCAKWGIEYKGP